MTAEHSDSNPHGTAATAATPRRLRTCGGSYAGAQLIEALMGREALQRRS